MKGKLFNISNQVDSTFVGDDFLDTDPPIYQSALDTLYNNYKTKFIKYFYLLEL